MPDPRLLLALLVGMVLGAMFFGGLWWTVQRAMNSRRVALWFFTSLVLRSGITLGGFIWPAATTGSAGWLPCSALSWRDSSSRV